MPAGTPFGLFDAATSQLLWVFPSLLAATKCCGFKQPPAALKNAVKDSGKYIHGKYMVGAIAKDEADAFPMDKSRGNDVAEIVKTNADWTIDAVTETVYACLKCGESKPFTAKYFRFENGYLNKTCRACRRDVVNARAAAKANEVQALIQEGNTTFTCTGNGVNPVHEAPMDLHLGDRDVYRDCYNAKRQVDSRGSLKRKRDQDEPTINIDVDAINQARASEVNEMEVPTPKTTKRKKPTHQVPHARATGITITNSSGAIVAVFPTIAAASKALGYANLSDQMAKSNNTIHGWHFKKVSAAQLPDMDRAAQEKFITDFKEIKGGIGKPKTRRHLRLQKDGDTHEFPSKSAAAEFLGVSEAGIRFGLKNSGVVRGYKIEEFDG
ncbi:hypothetical protein GGF31_003419 [Allomyces arbusculus]|nr:hypothetical protein GGF31_003419 [Allomyces arbusculus]